MKQGDHVKVIGRDGVYVFLKEVQGTATLRAGGAEESRQTHLSGSDKSGSLSGNNRIGSSVQPMSNLRTTIKENGAVVTHDSLPVIQTHDTQLGLPERNEKR